MAFQNLWILIKSSLRGKVQLFHFIMKYIVLICCVILLVYFKAVDARPNMNYIGDGRCVNMWDEGCINGQLPGSGNDDDYLNGGFNPGKRCMDVWDPGCTNGQLKSSGADENYRIGSFNPGRRHLYELLAKLQKNHQSQ